MPKTRNVPQKTVGILGGMGPYATVMFFRTLLDLTPAKKDWEHLRIVIDDNPHIPSRSRHVLYGEPSPVPGMIESCKKLEAYPVDFIALPCNSACFFLDQITPSVRIPILNIIKIAADALAAVKLGARCAVLGGRVTYVSRSYEKFLAARGLTYVYHGEDAQKEAEALIEDVKVNGSVDGLEGRYAAVVKGLQSELGVDAVIAGCTELSYFKRKFEGLTIVDSAAALAAEMIRLAFEGKPTAT